MTKNNIPQGTLSFEGQSLFMGKWQNAYGLVLEIFQQENWLRESYRLFIQKEMECKITAQVKKQAKV